MKRVKVCIICSNPITGGGKLFCGKQCRVINQANQDKKRYEIIRSDPVAIALQNKKSADRRKMLRRKFQVETIRVCPMCALEFHPNSRRVIYCSVKCRQRRDAKKASIKGLTHEGRRLRAAKELSRKQDLGYRLKCNVSKSIWQALRRKNRVKAGSTQKFLPYSIPQLKAHLESFFDNRNGFTWENYGSAWQIDHVIPHSMFHYTSMDSKAFRDCWALTNLMPSATTENQKKGARRLGSFDSADQGRLFA